MNKIIKVVKVVILTVVVLTPVIVLAKDNLNENLKIVSRGEVKVVSGRKKLSTEVLNFKTEKEEKLEENNKKRLDIYKNRLEKARFRQGKGNILVTGYSSTLDQCSGNPFITASGTHVHQGTMACPPQYPFGTKITIENVGTFICEDRGGAIKGDHFDMWFTSRSKALVWGKRMVVAEISK